MSTNAFKAPLPQPFHLPKRQVTLWDLHDHKQAPIPQQDQQLQHPRRASESIQQLQQQKDLLSKTLFPYQPMMGIQPLVPTTTTTCYSNDHNVQQQIFTVEPDEDPMQHLVLLPLGKTGAGKSSLLNLIMGYDEFKAKAAAKSVTDCITERTGIWSIEQSENIITVADTPGFADSMQRDEEFIGVFQEYIADLGNRLGIDAFMLVFQCDSSKNNIMAILDHFNDMMMQRFKKNTTSWWDHTLLVFTRVDYYPNLKLPINILTKKQSITETLIPEIQVKYNMNAPPKYAFVSSKAPNCSYNKKGQCDCFAASKYHLDQMRTLKSRINAIVSENNGRWTP